jgi:hypothetical protein
MNPGIVAVVGEALERLTSQGEPITPLVAQSFVVYLELKGVFMGVAAPPAPDAVPAKEYVHKTSPAIPMGAACSPEYPGLMVSHDYGEVTCPHCHAWRIRNKDFTLVFGNREPPTPKEVGG